MGKIINAVGRRKASVARVFLSEGNGEFLVNKKDYKEYFPQLHVRQAMLEPLIATGTEKAYNIKVNVKGGGFKGQGEAIRLGIARALIKDNPDFRPILKRRGLLTRDARVVERKKYGKPKARKSFQVSKR